MLLKRIEETEQHLRQFIGQHFGVELKRLTVETPPRTEFGDLAFPFSFELAKTLRRSPREIALQVAENIETPPHVDRFVAAGNGHLNVFFKRVAFFHDLHRWLNSPSAEPSGEKVIVEHTNINPNKAAHIGHLRNAALGDTLVRLLRARGRRVEVQNYIDNTCVQVADVVVGFQNLRQMSFE
jgi:arginyl-tRNA synthetase